MANFEKIQPNFLYQRDDAPGIPEGLKVALVSPADAITFCEGTYDCLSLLQQIGVTISVLAHSGPGPTHRRAEGALGAYEGYLRDQGMLLRTTVADTSSEEMSKLDTAVRIAREKSELLKKRDKRYGKFVVPQFIEAVAGAAQRLRQGHNDGHMVLFTISLPSRDQLKQPQQVDAMRDLSAWMLNTRNLKFPDMERLRIHQEIVQRLQQVSKNRGGPIPDMYTATFRGVSLAQLVKEKNQSRFIEKAMTYLQAFPRGNLLWQLVVEGMFFSHPTNEATLSRASVPENFFADPQLAQNILAFQSYFVTNMLVPFITGQERNRAFDVPLSKILVFQLDDNRSKVLGSMLVSLIYSYHYRARILNPDISPQKILEQFPLAGSIFQEESIEDFNRFDDLILAARPFFYFFEDHFAANFRPRFVEVPKVDQILDMFSVTFTGRYVEKEVGINVVSIARQILNPEEVEKYITATDAPGEMERALQSSRESKTLYERSNCNEDAEGLQCGLRFFPDSLPNLFGFATFSAYYPTAEDSTVKFMLQMVHRFTFIAGKMDRSGKVVEMHAEFEEGSNMPAIIGHIAKASHDFFQDAQAEAAEVVALPAATPREQAPTRQEKAYEVLSSFFEVAEKQDGK